MQHRVCVLVVAILSMLIGLFGVDSYSMNKHLFLEGIANQNNIYLLPEGSITSISLSNMGKDKCNANLFLFTSIDESLHQKVISFKEKL